MFLRVIALVLSILVVSVPGVAAANDGVGVCEPASVLMAEARIARTSDVDLFVRNVSDETHGPYSVTVYAYHKDNPSLYTITDTFSIPQLVPGAIYMKRYSADPFIPLGTIVAWFKYNEPNCNKVKIVFHRLYVIKVVTGYLDPNEKP